MTNITVSLQAVHDVLNKYLAKPLAADMLSEVLEQDQTEAAQSPTVRKDYELFIGPFSAHAGSEFELFRLLIVAERIGMITEEKAIDATHLIHSVVSGEAVCRSAGNVSIHDRSGDSK